jgi:hypothetical protein
VSLSPSTMAAVVSMYQIDMLIGKSLGSMDSVGWAMHLAARLCSVTLRNFAKIHSQPFDNMEYTDY